MVIFDPKEKTKLNDSEKFEIAKGDTLKTKTGKREPKGVQKDSRKNSYDGLHSDDNDVENV